MPRLASVVDSSNLTQLGFRHVNPTHGVKEAAFSSVKAFKAQLVGREEAWTTATPKLARLVLVGSRVAIRPETGVLPQYGYKSDIQRPAMAASQRQQCKQR